MLEDGNIDYSGLEELIDFQITNGCQGILAALKDATTVVGGGSTAEAVNSLGLSGMMTHVSTGGTASIQFMEGRVLPGVAALMDRTLV